jgi:hypothetical protein
MKAAIVILLAGGKSLQPGEEIPEGEFDDAQIAAFKEAGAIEGEGPNAEETGAGEGPVPASEDAETQAKERAAPQPAGPEPPKAGPPKTAGGENK